ncbi:hypothetical protein GA0070606_0372 [Micromonospora citrea]|uniref:Uncharacterized protein n=1 Tax=Micromonospora citrea TaxID=47855 RepID=A0A1C6TS23_9ACTN|nr:hypothetical protein GA0070606_0372 [Micromonospora citrea]
MTTATGGSTWWSGCGATSFQPCVSSVPARPCRRRTGPIGRCWTPRFAVYLGDADAEMRADEQLVRLALATRAQITTTPT